ncbi:hypothetical protein QQ045_018160 [Rhodiola kirilowii]
MGVLYSPGTFFSFDSNCYFCSSWHPRHRTKYKYHGSCQGRIQFRLLEILTCDSFMDSDLASQLGFRMRRQMLWNCAAALLHLISNSQVQISRSALAQIGSRI